MTLCRIDRLRTSDLNTYVYLFKKISFFDQVSIFLAFLNLRLQFSQYFFSFFLSKLANIQYSVFVNLMNLNFCRIFDILNLNKIDTLQAKVLISQLEPGNFLREFFLDFSLLSLIV